MANEKNISPVERSAVFLIRTYQVLLSPLLGQHCRFYPSCSQYTLEAIQEWGLVKGVWLGTKRICRCHPLNPGGIDPVPRRNQSAVDSSVESSVSAVSSTAPIAPQGIMPAPTTFSATEKAANSSSTDQSAETTASNDYPNPNDAKAANRSQPASSQDSSS